jgi:hypothetical protein
MFRAATVDLSYCALPDDLLERAHAVTKRWPIELGK